MIKRKALLALAAAASTALAGCTSGDLASGRFRAIHVIGLSEGARNDFPIQGFWEDSSGIETWIDGVRCFFSDGTYILIQDPDKCPICDLKGD